MSDLITKPFDYVLNEMCNPINVTESDIDELNEAMGIEDTEKERFKITNDEQAEWVICKIRESKIEHDRLIALADSEIQRITEQREKVVKNYENDTGYFNGLLSEYFETVPHKQTKAKTKETYALLTGVLTLKHTKPKMNPNKEALIKHLQLSGNTEYIKYVPNLKWAEFKEILQIIGDKVINTETGEVIQQISITEPTSTFEVELR